MESAFPSNSHNARQPSTEPEAPKNIQRVTTSRVIQRKKPLGVRFRETFFTGDASKGVFEYVTLDVVVPAMKNMIADAVSTGIERKLFGDAGSPIRRGGGYRPASDRTGYTSYNRMSPSAGPPSRREDPQALGRRGRGSFDFNQFLIGSRPEANEVLERMIDILSQYEVVSVRDFLGMIGEDAAHTDEKWGWTDLRGTKIHHAGGGYLIDLPRPIPLD